MAANTGGSGIRSWADQIKDRIRHRYTRLAEGESFPAGGARRLLEAGYPAGAVDRLPAELAGRYTGCGYPFPDGDVLEALNPATVLDLGCGAGIDGYLLVDRLKSDVLVLGLDLTPAMLAGVPNAVAGDMETLPVPNARADLIIANASLNLCVDKRSALAEAFRVLRPGGRLWARDLVSDGALPREVIEDPLSDAASLGGVESEERLAAHLSEAGFAAVTITDHRPFSFVTSVRIEAARPGQKCP